MTNEVAPLQSVQARITDKIKAEFVNLIPDKMWASMVAATLKEFTEDTPPSRDRYDREQPAVPSPLKRMIMNELEAKAKDAIKIHMNEHAPMWDSYGLLVASKATEKLIDDHFVELLASVQRGMVDTAVMQAVAAIRNGTMR